MFISPLDRLLKGREHETYGFSQACIQIQPPLAVGPWAGQFIFLSISGLGHRKKKNHISSTDLSSG